MRRRRVDRLPPREAIVRTSFAPGAAGSDHSGEGLPQAEMTAAAAKKTGREGQQRRLRDESGPARTALAGVLADPGTHVAQKLPGLAIVLHDAGIGFRGGSGHERVAPFGSSNATRIVVAQGKTTSGATLSSYDDDDPW